jgi:hypothetical protein
MGEKSWDKPLAKDGKEYEILTRAVKKVSCGGLSLEIGLRRGGGSIDIMKNLPQQRRTPRIHIAVDPYGHLPYENHDNREAKKMDYTNKMRNDSLSLLYAESEKLGVNFIFFNLSDDDFFSAFKDGVPVYDDERKLIKNYCFVHFDGPHTTEIVLKEFLWIDPRTKAGSVIVFDDINHYDHDSVEKKILSKGWNILEKGNVKAAYQK